MGNRRTGRVQLLYRNLRKNPALGLLPEASYQVFTHQLEENDIYVLFTDGVEEAMNGNDEYYGRERLEHVMSSAMQLDIGDLTQAIVGDILKFSGNGALTDDLCLVAVEAIRNEEYNGASVEQAPPENQTQCDLRRTS